MAYFNFLSWALSRLAFIGTHVVFFYWVNFIFNDPLGVGGNTLDPRVVPGPGTCRPFIQDNFVRDLGLFAVWWGTHSLFARKAYKQAVGLWAHPLERPIFATIAWIVWGAGIHLWRPITDCQRWNIFEVSPRILAPSLTVFALGALLVVGLLWSLPDHVFGTNKCRFAPGTFEPKGKIIYNFPYGLVRHPAAAGFLWMYWSLPAYTNNHLFLAILWTVFILAGTAFEEGGLKSSDSFGPDYVKYKTEVNAYIPKLSSIGHVFFGTGKSQKKRTE